MSLPPEVHAHYRSIIDEILSKSDLQQVSEKKIRAGIQERVEYDIGPQRAAIKELILERFDFFTAAQGLGTHEDVPVESVEQEEKPKSKSKINGHGKSTTVPSSNGVKRSASDEDDPVPEKPAKKRKPSPVEDDAAFAARLQAEENRGARASRNGARPGKAVKKAPKKKKSKANLDAGDDSEIDSADKPDRKVNRNTGFHKPMALSTELADLLGVTMMSRPQVTSQVWKYIKANDLQDPSDKRVIVPDERLKTILRQDKINMFKMTKAINEHIHDPDQ